MSIEQTRVATLSLPTGQSNDKTLLTPPQAICAIFALIEGDEAPSEIGRLPVGTNQLFTAPRMCGDWYSEVTIGKRAYCATGEDRIAAFRNLLTKVS